MKICFISREIFPFFYGGIGTQVYSQMQYFLKNGHEIYFLTEKPDNFCELEFKLKYHNIKVIFITRDANAYALHASLNYAFSLEKVFAYLYQEHKPDIVFLFDYAAEGFFVLLKRLEGKYRDIPFILELQGATYECLKYDAANPDNFFAKVSPWGKIQCYMEDLYIHLADYLLSPSEVTGQELLQRLDFQSECKVIPNSTNLEIFQLREPSKKELTYVKTVVYAGRLEKRKGVDLLLECFISILRESTEIETELVLLGRDLFWEEYGESFQSYWQHKVPDSIKHKIRFLGHCPQETLKNYFSNAWVAVFPSRWEPFGIVCLEAIASGCAVIVSKNTGLMEVVGTDYGIFFNQAEGVEGLKSVLLKILQDIDLCNALAKKSYLRAQELLAHDGKLTLEYVELIKKEFSVSVKTPRNKEILNLYLIFEEYDKLQKNNLSQTQQQLDQTQFQLQEEKLKTERLWAELCQDKQELERSQSQMQHTQEELERSQSQMQHTQEELERSQSQMQHTQEELERSQSQMQHTQEELERSQSQMQHTQEELERSQAVITAMQSSKFWKLRENWLKLKNIFGLGENR